MINVVDKENINIKSNISLDDAKQIVLDLAYIFEEENNDETMINDKNINNIKLDYKG